MNRQEVSQFFEKILVGDICIAVVGMGYVGFPLAVAFATAGIKTTCIDIDVDRVNKINSGHVPYKTDEAELLNWVDTVRAPLFATKDYSFIEMADVVLVAVQTPVVLGVPNLRYIRSAARSIGAYMTEGTMVVLNSTVAPGTTVNEFRRALESAYCLANHGTLSRHGDYFLGYSPERVTPGSVMKDLRSMPRIIGADDYETSENMKALYLHISDSSPFFRATILEAETAKVAENALRDVEIAYANEAAMLCDQIGVNVLNVRKLINSREDRNMLLPGAGVGGHCITKDGLLFASSAESHAGLTGNSARPFGMLSRLITTARDVNNQMPRYVYNLLVKALSEKIGVLSPVEFNDVIVAVLGTAYKPDTDDDRNSPTHRLLEIFDEVGIRYVIHDQYIEPHNFRRFSPVILEGVDAVVIMTAHSDYVDADWSEMGNLMRHRIMIDGRNICPDFGVEYDRWYYKGVGCD